MKKLFAMVLTLAMLCGLVPAVAQTADAVEIVLADTGVMVDGKIASTDENAAVYTANDIVFYLAGQDFTYGEGEAWEAHTQEEADAHTVVHITQPGTYVLSGSLSAGQVAVNVADGKKDPDAVVTLVLNGVDITCSVAPAVIFYNVYECGSTDEETAVWNVDTSAAGANVVIADGTVNNVTGSHVARMYDPEIVVLGKDGKKVEEAKKLHKYDAAFYSKRTMNVTGGEKGDGVLNIVSDNEGLDSELHLTINGGVINITAGNDGINTNEDNISVTTVNGGELNIVVSGTTGEGDGIDSNGWLVFNGGKVNVSGCGFSMDAGIDSDKGIYINGGEICAGGNMFDHVEGGDEPFVVFAFSGSMQGGSVLTLKNEAGEAVAEWSPENNFSYLVVSGEKLVPGMYTLWRGETQMAYTGSTVMAFGGPGMTPPDMPQGGGMPGGFDFNQAPPSGGFNFDMPEGFDPSQMTPPGGFGMPEGMEPPQDRPAGQGRGQGGPGGFGGFGAPEGFGGFGGGFPGFGGNGGEADGDQDTLFIITEEGGTYSGVAPLK